MVRFLSFMSCATDNIHRARFPSWMMFFAPMRLVEIFLTVAGKPRGWATGAKERLDGVGQGAPGDPCQDSDPAHRHPRDVSCVIETWGGVV